MQKFCHYSTYLLTSCCRVLLEKLTGLQLVKKFPAFHRTRRFITALTSVRHLPLSCASPIQSIYPHPTSWRSILILSTHLYLGLPSGLFPSGFPTKTLYTPSPHPYMPHAQPISFFSILSPAQYWVRSTDHLAPRYAVSSIPPLPREKWQVHTMRTVHLVTVRLTMKGLIDYKIYWSLNSEFWTFHLSLSVNEYLSGLRWMIILRYHSEFLLILFMYCLWSKQIWC